MRTNSSNANATNLIPASAIVVVSVYIAAQLLSDIGSLKIAWVAGFSVDAGTFIYPLTFTMPADSSQPIARENTREGPQIKQIVGRLGQD